MLKETTALIPTEEYEVTVNNGGGLPATFRVDPLPLDIKESVIEAESLGCEVIIMPEVNPTSIFIKYGHDLNKPVKSYGHEVVGIKMNLMMQMLGNYHHINRRKIKNFLSDLRASMKGEFPEKSSSKGVEWVSVINTYEY